MTSLEIINIARGHIGKGSMVSSAQLCLDDAVALYNEGKEGDAIIRARKSIAYSVGILHPDYQRTIS